MRIPGIKESGAKQGVALFMTLALITVMVSAAVGLSRWAGRSMATAALTSRQVVARELALSGIHLAMMILDQDAREDDLDSVQDAWADEEKMAEAVSLLELEKGQELSLVISDELSRIQVNALIQRYPGRQINPDQRALWERLLALVISADKSRDDRDPAGMANCLVDWLDSGDDDAVTGISGAESPYYGALDPPVTIANGPMTSLSELFQVKGFSRDVLKQAEQDLEMGIIADLTELQPEDVLTVHGVAEAEGETGRFAFPGRININTAGLPVLAALLPERIRDQASDLVGFREERTEEDTGFVNSLDKGWYRQVIELTDEEEKGFERLVMYGSTLFRAETIAAVDGYSVSMTGIIRREKNEETGTGFCRLLEVTLHSL